MLVVLQMALSLLAAPGLQSNPQMQKQALSFASQAVVIANSALEEQEASATSTPPIVSNIDTVPVPTSTYIWPESMLSPSTTPSAFSDILPTSTILQCSTLGGGADGTPCGDKYESCVVLKEAGEQNAFIQCMGTPKTIDGVATN